MSQGSGYIELNIEAMHIFLGDGRVDMAELERLLALALRDGEIDPDEKRVLGRIFGQVQIASTSADVLAKIAAVKRKHGIESLASAP